MESNCNFSDELAGPPQLPPIVGHRGYEWFIDSHTRRFRRLDNPHVCVELESIEGQCMKEDAGLAECPWCRATIRMAGSAGPVICPQCHLGRWED